MKFITVKVPQKEYSPQIIRENKHVAHPIMSYFWIQSAVVNVPQIVSRIGTTFLVRLFEVLNCFRGVLFFL